MKFFEPHELTSPTWQKLKKHLEAKLLELRARNDHTMDPIKTERLRGKIAQVKAILELERSIPTQED